MVIVGRYSGKALLVGVVLDKDNLAWELFVYGCRSDVPKFSDNEKRRFMLHNWCIMCPVNNYRFIPEGMKKLFFFKTWGAL